MNFSRQNLWHLGCERICQFYYVCIFLSGYPSSNIREFIKLAKGSESGKIKSTDITAHHDDNEDLDQSQLLDWKQILCSFLEPPPKLILDHHLSLQILSDGLPLPCEYQNLLDVSRASTRPCQWLHLCCDLGMSWTEDQHYPTLLHSLCLHTSDGQTLPRSVYHLHPENKDIRNYWMQWMQWYSNREHLILTVSRSAIVSSLLTLYMCSYASGWMKAENSSFVSCRFLSLSATVQRLLSLNSRFLNCFNVSWSTSSSMTHLLSLSVICSSVKNPYWMALYSSQLSSAFPSGFELLQNSSVRL